MRQNLLAPKGLRQDSPDALGHRAEGLARVEASEIGRVPRGTESFPDPAAPFCFARARSLWPSPDGKLGLCALLLIAIDSAKE